MSRRTILVVLMSTVLIAAGCALPTPQVPEAALQKVTLGNGGTAIGVDDPCQYLPGQLGFWKAEGLDVTVQPTGGSQEAIQLLVAGKVDFIQISPQTLATARAQDVKAVSVYTVLTRWDSLVGVLDGGPIQKVADLKGKTIGVPSLTSGHVHSLKMVLRDAGLNPDKDVEMVPTGFDANAGETLKSGKVAALAYWTSFFAGLENSGMKFRYFSNNQLKNAPGHALVTTEDLVKKDPALVEKMGRAYAKAAVFAAAQPEETVKLYWKAYPETKALNIPEAQALQESARILKAHTGNARVDDRTDKSWGWNDPDGWKVLADFLFSSGLMTKQVPADQMFTNQFVKAFNQFDAAQIAALKPG